MLVSVFGVQPIIATLVLMTAGRGIALLITDGQIVTVTSAPFKILGAGLRIRPSGGDPGEPVGVRAGRIC